jgi:dTDP-4-amino-4,6-dideoxygalactose transaminase
MKSLVAETKGAARRPPVAFLDLTGNDPRLWTRIHEAVREVASQAAFIGGPAVASFEKSFSKFCGDRCVVGVANGSDALYLALRSLGVGPGDEVVAPALSFVATAQAITRCGADVRFVDVEPDGWNLDAALLADALTEKTRAIVAVHLFGRPAEMDEILAVASRRNLAVVEDAAQAHGALYRRRPVGSIGDAAAFSFYPTKNLGAWGDAGAVAVGDASLAARVRSMANHAVTSDGDYHAEGINSRLDAVQAAVLRVKIEYLAGWNERRRQLADRYREQLEGLPLSTPSNPPHLMQVHHVFPLRIEAGRRDELAEFLRERGVETRIYYRTPLPRLAGYKHTPCANGRYPQAERAGRELLAVPLHPHLSDADVDWVAQAIRSFFEG